MLMKKVKAKRKEFNRDYILVYVFCCIYREHWLTGLGLRFMDVIIN